MNNNSLQGALQEAIRSALGCANSFEGDLHALCDLYGIANGHQDARLIGAAQKHDSTIGTASGALNYFLLNPSVLPTFGLNFTDGTERLDSRITFTRASGRTRWNSSGVLETLGNNVPAFDYDPITLAIKGMLIEEQRTRLNTIALSPTAPENITVTAQAYTVSFYGTGQITLSGAASQVITSAGAYPNRKTVTFTPSAGTLTITPSGQVLDLQLEAGSFATSVIRGSEGFQATRAADVAVVSSLAGWFNASEGTLVVESEASPNASANYVVIDDGSSTANSIYFDNNAGSVRNVAFSGSSAVSVLNLGAAPSAGSVFRMSGAFKLNDFAGVKTGGSVATDTQGAVPVSPTIMRIGANSVGAAAGTLSAHMRRISFYPTRLSNATLQALTA